MIIIVDYFFSQIGNFGTMFVNSFFTSFIDKVFVGTILDVLTFNPFLWYQKSLYR